MCTPHRTARTPRLSERTRVRSHERVALPPTAARRGREPAAMGYRGKVKEQEKARALRARNHTLADIAQVLGVVEVVGLPLGPRRPVHTDPPTARGAPAPAPRA